MSWRSANYCASLFITASFLSGCLINQWVSQWRCSKYFNQDKRQQISSRPLLSLSYSNSTSRTSSFLKIGRRKLGKKAQAATSGNDSKGRSCHLDSCQSTLILLSLRITLIKSGKVSKELQRGDLRIDNRTFEEVWIPASDVPTLGLKTSRYRWALSTISTRLCSRFSIESNRWSSRRLITQSKIYWSVP